VDSGDEIALLKHASEDLKMRLAEERDGGGGEAEIIRARTEGKHQKTTVTGYVLRWNPGSATPEFTLFHEH
jgi:hypothetical protein